jgi:hypothetical protein
MDDTWPPKHTPKVTQEFNKSADMEQPKHPELKGLKPFTKAEVERLKAERDKPNNTPSPQMRGQSTIALKNMEAKQREEKIKKMKARLDAHLGKVKDDFNRSI